MPAPVIAAIIGAGTSLGGAAIASHGQSEAADKQADAIGKGVDLEREMYQQDRADLEPYRAIGAGGLSQLGYLAGIPSAAPAAPAAPASSLSSLGQAVPRGSVPMNTPQRQPMVSVRSPKGTVGQIPASMLSKALAAGGVQV